MITRNVFLDTQVFVEKNFSYDSQELSGLRELGKLGVVHLLLTQITAGEIQKKIGERARDAERVFADAKKLAKDRGNITILRNVIPMGFDAVFRFDRRAIENELVSQFERYVEEARITLVTSDGVDVDSVFAQYFEGRPPFENREDKKHEFPDAFAVAAMARWCEVNTVDAYVVSADKGLRRAADECPRLISLERVTDLTGLVAAAQELQVATALAWFAAAREYVVHQIADEFQSLGFTLLDEEGEVLEATTDASRIQMEKPRFLRVSESYANLAVGTAISFEAHVAYDDPDSVVYDEGERFVHRTVRTSLTRTVQLDTYVELGWDPERPAGEAEDDVENAVLAVTLSFRDVYVYVHERDPHAHA
jgi:hypothetical protein